MSISNSLRKSLSFMLLWIFTIYNTGFAAQLHFCSGYVAGISINSTSSCCAKKANNDEIPIAPYSCNNDDLQSCSDLDNKACCSDQSFIAIPDWDNSYLSSFNLSGEKNVIQAKSSTKFSSLYSLVPFFKADLFKKYTDQVVITGAHRRIMMSSFRC